MTLLENKSTSLDGHCQPVHTARDKPQGEQVNVTIKTVNLRSFTTLSETTSQRPADGQVDREYHGLKSFLSLLLRGKMYSIKFSHQWQDKEMPLSVQVDVENIYYKIGRDSEGKIEITTNDPSFRLDIPEIKKLTEKRANKLLKIYQKMLKSYSIYRPDEKLLRECKDDFVRLGFDQNLMEEVYEETRKRTDFFISKESPLNLLGPITMIKGGEFVLPGEVYKSGLLFRLSHGVINNREVSSIFIPRYYPLRTPTVKHEFKHALQYHLIRSLFDTDSKLYEEFPEKEKMLMKTCNLLKEKFENFKQLIEELDSVREEERLKFISENRDKLATTLMYECFSKKYIFRAGANFESTATTPRGNVFHAAGIFGIPTLMLSACWQAVMNHITFAGPYAFLLNSLGVMALFTLFLPYALSLRMIKRGYGNLFRYRKVKRLLRGKNELNKVLSYLVDEDITL